MQIGLSFIRSRFFLSPYILWHAPKVLPEVCEGQHELQPTLAALHNQPVQTLERFFIVVTCKNKQGLNVTFVKRQTIYVR